MTSEERREARYRRRRAAREAKRARSAETWDNYDRVNTFGGIYDGGRISARGVRWKPSVQKYNLIRGQRVLTSYTELKARKIAPVKFIRFKVRERGKVREIEAVGMKTRAEQRNACDRALMPAITRNLIYDCGACVKKKGQTFAEARFMRHLTREIKKNGLETWVVFYDFKGYFKNIPHAEAKADVSALFRDRDLVYQFHAWIDIFKKPGQPAVGLGLGCQHCQGLALERANKLDHFMKERLRVRGYGRYNDDGYAFFSSKEKAQQALAALRELCEKLKIKLNEAKTHIQKITQPMHYLKKVYKVVENGRVIKLLSRESKTRQRRKLKKLVKKVKAGKMTVKDVWQSFQSWASTARRCDAYNAIWNMKRYFWNLLKGVQACTTS